DSCCDGMPSYLTRRRRVAPAMIVAQPKAPPKRYDTYIRLTGGAAMQRKLTITVSDEVYRGLHHRVGRGAISRFIEDLVRPHVVVDDELEALYRQAAQDATAEREAREWIEADLGEETP